MAYTNITPPTLPAYDSATYGFYLLVFNYTKDAEDWYMVHLYYCSWRFRYEDGVGVVGSPVTFHSTYSDGSWSEIAEIDGQTIALNPGLTGNVYQRIYTNHNIFNGDEIWLVENSATPVEVEKFDLHRFLTGLAMGLCSKGTLSRGAFPQREPVAFLYNGVRLPGLPVVEGFEFEVLTRHVVDGTERYQLSVFAAPFYAQTFSDGITYVRSNPSAKYQKWVCNAPDLSEWKLESEGNWWAISYEDVCWTNHNIYFGDLVNGEIVYSDELFMTKSPAPVPVYE